MLITIMFRSNSRKNLLQSKYIIYEFRSSLVLPFICFRIESDYNMILGFAKVQPVIFYCIIFTHLSPLRSTLTQNFIPGIIFDVSAICFMKVWMKV